MSADSARTKLDDYVALRGAIAHRGAGPVSVHKSRVQDYYQFVKRLVDKTGGRVDKAVQEATGEIDDVLEENAEDFVPQALAVMNLRRCQATVRKHADPRE